MIFSLTLAFFGLWLLWSRWRLPGDEGHRHEVDSIPRVWPHVTIIVPARNEAKVLPRLLDSLAALTYSSFDVVVVDDQSTDGTSDIVIQRHELRFHVICGKPKPSDWGGKQWACHQGAMVARGTYLLFTDADTWHTPNSLTAAIAEAQQYEADLLSGLPFHAGKAVWERLSGPFHVLLLTVTAPFGKPRPGRVFAIGQYLLFRRDAYDLLGGHAVVKSSLVEDLPLANRSLRQGLRYRVVTSREPLFQVRMYDSLGEFLRGWRRNFRAGLSDSSLLAPVEMTAMISALIGAGGAAGWVLTLILMLVAMILVGRAQARLGSFSPLGVLLFPWGLALLMIVTGLAVYDMLTGRATVWKGRSYSPPGS